MLLITSAIVENTYLKKYKDDNSKEHKQYWICLDLNLEDKKTEIYI